RAVGRLPTGYRTVFLLHDVEGLAHSEIARNLGCTIGTSKSQLHQARVQLRHFLRPSTIGRRHKQRNIATFKYQSRRPSASILNSEPLLNNVPWIPPVGVPE